MTLLRALKHAGKAALRPFFASVPAVHGATPSHWGLTIDAKGKLVLDGVVLHDLGQRVGFPVHVVDFKQLRRNADAFLRVPAGAPTGCEVFYSYKTNPVPGVLADLHAAGIGAEVISHYELWLARRLGVPPDRIVFNGPAKSPAAIAEAIDAGIQLLNINHREEIALVSRIAVERGRRARVGIRITVGEGWHGQFGVPVEGGHARAAFQEALQSPFLDVVGLHAHRGGMIRSVQELDSFAGQVLAFAGHLSDELGLTLEIVDFGGSLCTPTVTGLDGRELRLNRAFGRPFTPPDPDDAVSIPAYVAFLVEKVDTFYRTRGRPRPRIFVEPGRALTGNAQLLLASVSSINDDGGKRYAILDAGINIAEGCRSEYHHLFSANRAHQPPASIYTVVGPICTPGDTLYWAAPLPDMSPGDSVAIMDAGAYFVPFSTSFSFPRPSIVSIDSGQLRILRRAEQFEDLVGLDHLT